MQIFSYLRRMVYYIFIEHPTSIRESYFKHFTFAFKNGLYLLVLGVVCVIHALLPCLFKSYASSGIQKLHQLFQQRNLKN